MYTAFVSVVVNRSSYSLRRRDAYRTERKSRLEKGAPQACVECEGGWFEFEFEFERVVALVVVNVVLVRYCLPEAHVKTRTFFDSGSGK